MLTTLRDYAKAIAALLGSVGTFLLTVNAPPEWQVWVGSATALATTIATFGVSNGSTDPAVIIAKNAQKLQDAEAALNAQKNAAKTVLTDVLRGVPIVGGELSKRVGDLIP